MEMKVENNVAAAIVLQEDAKPVNNKAYLALGLISLIWGSTWVVSKIGVQGVPGLQLAYIRQLCAGLAFITFFKIKGEPWPKLADFKWILPLSLFLIVFANGVTTWSIKYIPSGLGALIGTLYPLCVVIIEAIWFKNNPNNRITIIGMLLGFSGIVIVFYQNAFHHQPDGYLFGVALSLLATISWSLGHVLIARKKLDMNPYYAMGWQMLVGSFFIFLLAKITGNNIPFEAIPVKSWIATLYLICFGSIAAFIGFIYTMKNLPPAIASTYAYINPIIALIIGSIVLNEKLTFTIVAGSVVTLMGVYIVSKSIKKS